MFICRIKLLALDSVTLATTGGELAQQQSRWQRECYNLTIGTVRKTEHDTPCAL